MNLFFVASGPLIWKKTSGRRSNPSTSLAFWSLSSLTSSPGDVKPTYLTILERSVPATFASPMV